MERAEFPDHERQSCRDSRKEFGMSNTKRVVALERFDGDPAVALGVPRQPDEHHARHALDVGGLQAE